MSTTAPSSKVIDATSLVESLTFRTGVSAKTGNPYIIGSVKIKKPSGGFYNLDLGYMDENASGVVNEALASIENERKEEFADGLKD